jgi:hypothetical protein
MLGASRYANVSFLFFSFFGAEHQQEKNASLPPPDHRLLINLLEILA